MQPLNFEMRLRPLTSANPNHLGIFSHLAIAIMWGVGILAEGALFLLNPLAQPEPCLGLKWAKMP